MTNEDLTRREHQLITRLRIIDSTIASLTSERSRIRTELEYSHPALHALAIQRVPKDEVVVLNVFNYKAQGYTASCATTAQGLRLLDDATEPSLKLEDYLILALCKGRQADVAKLVKLPQLLELSPRPASRVHQLWRRGLLEVKFEMVKVVV